MCSITAPMLIAQANCQDTILAIFYTANIRIQARVKVISKFGKRLRLSHGFKLLAFNNALEPIPFRWRGRIQLLRHHRYSQSDSGSTQITLHSGNTRRWMTVRRSIMLELSKAHLRIALQFSPFTPVAAWRYFFKAKKFTTTRSM